LFNLVLKEQYSGDLGITPVYGSFVKFCVTANLCSFIVNLGNFVDMSTNLLTLAVTRTVLRSSEIFDYQQNFRIEQFHGHSENAKKFDFMQFSELP
jgi:hypothetical protein